jgi:Transposase IS66 family
MPGFVPASLRVFAAPNMAAAPAVRSTRRRRHRQGLASPALLAHLLVSKYCNHIPLYRQTQIFACHGLNIDRSTLVNWVGGACWWLEPGQARLAAHVFGSTKLFADDITDPGARPRPRPQTGGLWSIKSAPSWHARNMRGKASQKFEVRETSGAVMMSTCDELGP